MNLNDPFQNFSEKQNYAFSDTHNGIEIVCATMPDARTALLQFIEHLATIGIAQHVQSHLSETNGIYTACFRLNQGWANIKDRDTLQLCQRFKLDTHRNIVDLEREILLAMLLCPVPFSFPSYQELASALRIRKNIVYNARKTALSFATGAAERPEEYWTYHEDNGFTLVPGKSLITALQKATQPDESGKLYSFSCYRATEYVVLLSVAQELSHCNPKLYQQLQQQWEKKAIMSGKFHDIFLYEYGSMEQPLPPKYYVPGDRLWFRNPHEYSSDATGYEGSWVFYMGNGQFTNFWERDKPYTLTTKCLEIFHWRNATSVNADNELHIDETKVEAMVLASNNNPQQVQEILDIMLRLREPKGIYLYGGCIDTSREYPRLTCPGTCDMDL